MKNTKSDTVLEVLSYAIPIGLMIHIISISFPKKTKLRATK